MAAAEAAAEKERIRNQPVELEGGLVKLAGTGTIPENDKGRNGVLIDNVTGAQYKEENGELVEVGAPNAGDKKDDDEVSKDKARRRLDEDAGSSKADKGGEESSADTDSEEAPSGTARNSDLAKRRIKI
jgi:hypothetical protein